MIKRSSQGQWQSSLLNAESWLRHCFGTAVAPPPEGFLVLKQIHSTKILEAGRWSPECEGDGLIAGSSGMAVGVKTADCVPILLADPRRRVVAAVHAGWKGTADGIAVEAVRRLALTYQSDPGELLAAFGPSIGPCCFEVGPDVGPLFRQIFPECTDLEGKTKIDLREANARLLASAGVDHGNIDRLGAPCTCCGGSEFHSWRRDRIPGLRMHSVIEIL